MILYRTNRVLQNQFWMCDITHVTNSSVVSLAETFLHLYF